MKSANCPARSAAAAGSIPARCAAAPKAPACPLTMWVKTAPSAAVPVAMPTWRNVELMPDAMPARCGSTTAMAAVASAGFTAPMPPPATMKPASIAVQSSPGPMSRISSRPSPTRTRPPEMNQRTP